MLAFSLTALLVNVPGIPSDGWRIVLLGPTGAIGVVTLVPRFILTLRQLYEHGVQSSHCGSGIDTPFGLASASGWRGTLGSAIVFLDAGQNEGLQEGDEIPMHEVEVCSDSG